MPGTPRHDSLENKNENPDLTAAEFDQRVENVFHAIDTDDSNSISVHEITNFIDTAGLSQPVVSSLTKKLFELWDQDKQHDVDLDEFRDYFKPTSGDGLDQAQLEIERKNLLSWFENLAAQIAKSTGPINRRRTSTVSFIKREQYPTKMAELSESITTLVDELDAKVDKMLTIITDFHAKQRTVAAAKGRRKSQRKSVVKGVLAPREAFCGESVDIPSEEYLNGTRTDDTNNLQAMLDAEMTAELKGYLRNELQSNFLFHDVDESSLDSVIQLMKCFDVAAGMDLFEVGAKLDSIYVIESGSCEIQGADEFAERLEPMAFIGNLALVRTDEQTNTLTALENVRLWGLERIDFRNFLARDASANARKVLNFIKKVELLKPLANETHVAIARAMTHKTFVNGDVIMKEGAKPDNFYVIQSGQVAVTKLIGENPNYFLCNLGKGDFFGELAFLNDKPRAATITATQQTECYVLGKDEFQSIIGSLKDVLEERHIMRLMHTSLETFKQADDDTLKTIIHRFAKVKYAKGEYIIKEGDPGDAFFIIETGVCSIVKYNNTAKKNLHLAKLHSGKYFGERGLMPGEEGKRAASVLAHDDDVKVLKLGRDDFIELVAPFFEEQQRLTGKKFVDASVDNDGELGIDEEAVRHKREVAALPGKNLRDNILRVSTQNIDIRHSVAKGVFGNYKHIKTHDGNDRLMKCFQKSRVLALQRKQNPLREKQALLRVENFTYISRLYATASDHDQLYLMMDYPMGGDVHSAVHAVYSEGIPKHPEFDGLAVDLIVQWTAMVVSALEHIHSRGIVHRDLKPENIKIDSQGSLKLVDFSLSKLLPYEDNEGIITDETYTLCGTIEYLAPEVILSHGHSFAVDFWSLGILIYELFCRVTPFEADDDNLETLHRIINCHQYLGFPHGFDPNAKTLIRNLLTPTPGARMGCWKGGFNDIKSHVFFYLISSEEVDWNKIADGTCDKVYVPENVSPGEVETEVALVPYASLGVDDHHEFFGAF